MNLYLDTSALVKRYVEEPGSEDVLDWMDLADTIGTGLASACAAISPMNTRSTFAPSDISNFR